MQLAEALILRAFLQKQTQALRGRLKQNAREQEGDEPSESPHDLLQELERNADELVSLIRRINRTNCITEIDAGVTLTDALAERDVLKIRYWAHRELAEAAVGTQHRYLRSEIRMLPTVDVAVVQHRATELARAYRELDTRIQQLNWQTELFE